MIQIVAGMAVTEDRKEITTEDIEWVVHSSQLTPKNEQKIADEPQVGIVNGLAVYGPNSGALLEIEVNVTPAQDKGSLNITGIAEEESIGVPIEVDPPQKHGEGICGKCADGSPHNGHQTFRL